MPRGQVVNVGLCFGFRGLLIIDAAGHPGLRGSSAGAGFFPVAPRRTGVGSGNRGLTRPIYRAPRCESMSG